MKTCRRCNREITPEHYVVREVGGPEEFYCHECMEFVCGEVAEAVFNALFDTAPDLQLVEPESS